MNKNNITAVMLVPVLMFSLTACAGISLKDNAGKQEKQKTSQQLKLEKEEETRGMFIKGIASFAGLIAGGLIGLLTAPKQNAVTTAIGGGIAGGALGFGLGMVIFDNTKPGEKNPDEGKVKEYFQDYRNMQLKE